jgi:hypothetical protein
MFLFVNSIFLKSGTSKSNSIFKTLCSLRYNNKNNKNFMTVIKFYSKRGLKFERMYGKKNKYLNSIFLIASCKIFVFTKSVSVESDKLKMCKRGDFNPSAAA